MASFSDKTIKIITITAIYLYASIFIVGYAMHQLQLYIAIINAVTGTAIISYWIRDKMRPLKRLTETRELVVLLIESIIVIAAICTIFFTSLTNWLTIVQYIVFAIHALLLILFLIFMLTFKIKKLF